MSALLLTACYDDSEMKSRLDKMDQRLTTVESQVASLNTQLTKLQGLMDGKLFISNIEDKEDGTHVITFVDVYGGMSTMTLTDGQAPDISVKQTPDGKWYWTVNGEWLLDSNGNKVPVTGEQGVTPSMKIEDGKWKFSKNLLEFNKISMRTSDKKIERAKKKQTNFREKRGSTSD